jgi:hypothetical protein
MVAYIESVWVDRFSTCQLYRYELSPDQFVSLDDAGMYVSKSTPELKGVEHVGDLGTLMGSKVELRIIERLQEVAHSLTSSLHFSAIRYRNAIEWDPPI